MITSLKKIAVTSALVLASAGALSTAAMSSASAQPPGADLSCALNTAGGGWVNTQSVTMACVNIGSVDAVATLHVHCYSTFDPDVDVSVNVPAAQNGGQGSATGTCWSHVGSASVSF